MLGAFNATVHGNPGRVPSYGCARLLFRQCTRTECLGNSVPAGPNDVLALPVQGGLVQRPKFDGIPGPLITALLQQAGGAHMVKPTMAVNISPHEPDNCFYECAAEALADYIVTGNRKHFPKPFKTSKIINARQLLSVLAAGEEDGDVY